MQTLLTFPFVFVGLLAFSLLLQKRTARKLSWKLERTLTSHAGTHLFVLRWFGFTADAGFALGVNSGQRRLLVLAMRRPGNGIAREQTTASDIFASLPIWVLCRVLPLWIHMQGLTLPRELRPWHL